jgi:Tfp pilus assembly protein PilV
MLISKIARSQRGDTIVEVLIAIAIMSAALSSAYGITNNSIKSNQESQEHGVALKLAESQLEQLKSHLKAEKTVPGSPASFCMYTASNETNVEVISGAMPNTNFSLYPANCKLDEGLAIDRYNAVIIRTGDTYKVHVDWDGPKGEVSSESLVYRVY